MSDFTTTTWSPGQPLPSWRKKGLWPKKSKSRASRCLVYAMRSTNKPGLVKIGYTTFCKAQYRLDSMKRYSWYNTFNLVVEKELKGHGFGTEKLIHKELKKAGKHVKREMFRLSIEEVAELFNRYSSTN